MRDNYSSFLSVIVTAAALFSSSFSVAAADVFTKDGYSDLASVLRGWGSVKDFDQDADGGSYSTSMRVDGHRFFLNIPFEQDKKCTERCDLHFVVCDTNFTRPSSEKMNKYNADYFTKVYWSEEAGLCVEEYIVNYEEVTEDGVDFYIKGWMAELKRFKEHFGNE